MEYFLDILKQADEIHVYCDKLNHLKGFSILKSIYNVNEFYMSGFNHILIIEISSWQNKTSNIENEQKNSNIKQILGWGSINCVEGDAVHYT